MSNVRRLDPTRVKPFAAQPRKRFRGIRQLADSIEAVGQVTPCTVRLIRDPEYDAELVDGERRLKACLLLGRKIKALIEEEGETQGSQFARSVAANMCRQEHDVMEIAEAIRALRDEGRTAEEIAKIFGKSVAWVYNHALLLELAPEVQAMLCKAAGDHTKKNIRRPGRLTYNLALLLTPLSHAQQARIAATIAKKKLPFTAARNCILRAREAAGKPQRVRSAESSSGGTRSCGMETFWGVTVKYRAAAERLAELEYQKLTATVAQLTPSRARTLADWLACLRDDLRGIETALKKRGQA